MEKKWTRLIQARKANHFTQVEIAERCGVNQSTYVRWECMKFQPSIQQLKTLSMVLNVPIDYLIHNDMFNVGDLDYWMQLAEVRNTYRRFIAEHPKGIGQYRTREDFLEFVASKYAPGPYSFSPDDLDTGDGPNPEDPFPPSIYDIKK